jgi:mRNA interferase MazF
MSMMSYKPRDIILVPFPFSDLSGEKQRPALVLAVADKWSELVCIMLTSSPKGNNEVPVKQWKQACLPKYTVARVHRIFTIETKLIRKKIGKVEQEDYKEILAAVAALLIKGY